jgi:hypothetical protein
LVLVFHRYGDAYEQTAKPFQWTFTRADFADLLAKLNANAPARRPDRKYVTVIVKHST